MKFAINAVSDTVPPPCQPCKVEENELGQLPSMLGEADTSTMSCPQSLPSGPQSEVVLNRTWCCPQSYHDCVSTALSWRSVFHSWPPSQRRQLSRANLPKLWPQTRHHGLEWGEENGLVVWAIWVDCLLWVQHRRCSSKEGSEIQWPIYHLNLGTEDTCHIHSIQRLCHSRSLEPMRNFINFPLVNIDGCWWMLHEKHWLTHTKFGLFVILAPDSCLYNICLPFLSTYITLCFDCFTLRVVTGWLLYRDPTCRQCLYTCTPVINSSMLSNACQRSGAERKRPPFSLCVWQCSYYFLVNIWLYCTMNELHVDSASFLYHSS